MKYIHNKFLTILFGLLSTVAILYLIPVSEVGDYDVYKNRIKYPELESIYYSYLNSFSSLLELKESKVKNDYFKLTPFSYRENIYNHDRLLIFLINSPFFLFSLYLVNKIFAIKKIPFYKITFFNPLIILYFSMPSVDVVMFNIFFVSYYFFMRQRFVKTLLVIFIYFIIFNDKGALVLMALFLFSILFYRLKFNYLLLITLTIYCFIAFFGFSYLLKLLLLSESYYFKMLVENSSYGSYPFVLFVTSMFTSNIFSYTYYFGGLLSLFVILTNFKKIMSYIVELKLMYFFMFTIIFSLVAPNIISVKYLPFLFVCHLLILLCNKKIFYIYNYFFIMHLLLVGLYL